MLSSARVPDDERKGRRLGDETKGRIADLASGWTVDSDVPRVPEPPVQREASGPDRTPDAPSLAFGGWYCRRLNPTTWCSQLSDAIVPNREL